MNARPISGMSRSAQGFTLVELMIAMVLGLLVIGAVVGVFLSNQQVNRQNEAIARMQESARYAFEVMARDIREAGGIACGKGDGSGLTETNVLNHSTANWWSNWDENKFQGFGDTDNGFPRSFGTNAGDRVSGTDALIIMSGTVNDGVYITDHNRSSAQFKVNTTAHGIVRGDILLVCDDSKAAIFQVTEVESDNSIIRYNTTSDVSPGNRTTDLGPQPFNPGGFISKLSATGWYIGHNGRGGRSLYRIRLQNNSGTATTSPPEEIAEGISDLQLQYLFDNQYSDLPGNGGRADWRGVSAVRLRLTTQTLEHVGSDNQPIRRDWYTVISLRSRLP